MACFNKRECWMEIRRSLFLALVQFTLCVITADTYLVLPICLPWRNIVGPSLGGIKIRSHFPTSNQLVPPLTLTWFFPDTVDLWRCKVWSIAGFGVWCAFTYSSLATFHVYNLDYVTSLGPSFWRTGIICLDVRGSLWGVIEFSVYKSLTIIMPSILSLPSTEKYASIF